MKNKKFLYMIHMTTFLAVLGIILVNVINRQAFKQIVKERDKQLFSLAISIDNALVHDIEDIKQDPLSIMKTGRYKEGEKHYLESGEKSGLEYPFASFLLDKRRGVAAIIIDNGTKLDSFDIDPDENRTEYYIASDTEDPDVFVFADDSDQYYIGIRVQSPNIEKLKYYFLIDIGSIYDHIIPKSLSADNWVVLFHARSGLASQSHPNQKPYLRLSKEEYEQRQDGYTMIMHKEELGERGAQTYRYANLQGKVVPERLITLPSCETQNGIFAIGIARDSELFYSSLRTYHRYQMMITALLILVSGSLIFFALKGAFDKENLIHDMKHLEKEKELDRKLTLAQMQNSVSQMQPHFMYNALSSIRELIYENPDYAADMLYEFTTYLRGCIHAMANQNMIPFDEEMRNIEAYANIEKMRIGDQLELIYEVDDNDFVITPLAIQPLVENSIRHGISKRRGKWGTVKVSCHLSPSTLVNESPSSLYHVIKVEDNGIGFDYEQIQEEIASGKRDSTGLINVVNRLTYLMHARVDIDSKPGEGCRITVEIPVAIPPEGKQ